jgi:ligand-binding SRPBCC domain-containing protein
VRQPYSIDAEVTIRRPIDEVFAFFADASNLQQLTPDWLDFRIVTPSPIDMKPGTLIDYRIRVRFLPLKWRTRITEWNPPHRFVDDQIRGPYKLWHHVHTFEQRDGHTLVRDHVDYIPRGGPLVHRWFVRPDVEKIFAYRTEQLRRVFADDPAGKA